MINVYDEKGMQIWSKPISSGSLQGYTATTVSVRIGNMMHIYDERGMQVRRFDRSASRARARPRVAGR
jgi:hypothetical protein